MLTPTGLSRMDVIDVMKADGSNILPNTWISIANTDKRACAKAIAKRNNSAKKQEELIHSIRGIFFTEIQSVTTMIAGHPGEGERNSGRW